MIYYNQHNYSHIPYPSPTLPKATVKSGGCGVCCASMVVGELGDSTVPPEKMAPYAITVGARVVGGTDMRRLSDAISRDFALEHKESSSIEELLETLREGGMAICNPSGDTKTRSGIFSNGGHYIVAAGIATDGRIIIYDPGLYSGKYNLPHRKEAVTLDGSRLLVKADILHADCAARAPRYHLFKGGEDMTGEHFNEMAEERENRTNPIYLKVEDVPEYWREDVKELIALGAIKGDGKNPVAMRRETLKAVIVAHRLYKRI